MNVKLSFILVFMLSVPFVTPISWTMHPNTQNCLREDLRKNVLVKGDYKIVPAFKNHVIDYIVRDSKGHILANKQDITKGKFSFIIENDDMFEICFTSHVPSYQRAVMQEVTLNIKTVAKTNERPVEVAKLKPLELKLKMLKELASSICLDFADRNVRFEEMRNINESTGKRFLGLGIFSTFCVIGLSVCQIIYYLRYFKANKLIE